MKWASLILGLAFLGEIGIADEAGELTPKELAAARKLYVAKCAKCHRFYEPTNYAEVDWRRWMESMGRKSKLRPSQQELLDRYLDAYRAGRLPHRPEAGGNQPEPKARKPARSVAAKRFKRWRVEAARRARGCGDSVSTGAIRKGKERML